MTNDKPRLIEVAFPLKQTSLASVHEKNVRHGHISTLHIWPARRPLAACRAALIATLLPDPGNKEERDKLLERLGGKVVEVVKKKTMPDGHTEEQITEDVAGGILKWGSESSPDLDWFREEIHKAYGGQPPKVLDPFAGGGAIPLEAMRLGCEVTAVDINPVAWFILKCTLEYPQKLAGQKRPLPDFILRNREFMEAFFKAQGLNGPALEAKLEEIGLGQSSQISMPGMETHGVTIEANLAWHVRAWGQWVLDKARTDLAHFYPTYADFEPLKPTHKEYSKREISSVPTKTDGSLDLDTLNAEFSQAYLDDKINPRWVAKPTVAYLWARTVKCKNCRATIPLLKTRWLCQKSGKNILLIVEPIADKTGVTFGVTNSPPKGEKGEGTMSGSGVTCPCCGVIMKREDLQQAGFHGQLGSVMTAVVVDGLYGKEYRLPTSEEICLADQANERLSHVFSSIPFGLPEEPVPQGASRTGGGSPFTVHQYGLIHWCDLFTHRQLLALGTFVNFTRVTPEVMRSEGYSTQWIEAVVAYMAITLDRQADYSSAICMWHNSRETLAHTFTRYALPMIWDYCEVNCFSETTGGFQGGLEWVARVVQENMQYRSSPPTVTLTSATKLAQESLYDVVITDPPYYDAIPYADTMDFFYVWLRRTLHSLSSDIDKGFQEPLISKWNYETNDGELIDDPARFGGDNQKSKKMYEDGMARAFQACHRVLKPEGRLVIVFANKNPDAWETLVSAIIRAGFVVDGSWPIQTEMNTRMRAKNSAALSSSIWLVCKKRSKTARPGWDNRVLTEMQQNIIQRLRDFWDAGIRGPDFVWAATGPALEAFSQHPVVKKANDPGQVLTVSEFLGHVRRIVLDFVVGRVLSQNGGTEAVSGLDDVTTYYLLHRNDFGLDEASSGASILYALSCNLSDRELSDRYDLMQVNGSTVKLKSWKQRTRPNMGYDPAVDSLNEQLRLQPALPGLKETVTPYVKRREIPLIDQIHRLMHLWKSGDVRQVDDYLNLRGLRRNILFHQLLQALIELAYNEERALLESISNHLAARGVAKERLL